MHMMIESQVAKLGYMSCMQGRRLGSGFGGGRPNNRTTSVFRNSLTQLYE